MAVERAAVLDLCEVLGVVLNAAQRAQLEGLGPRELAELRQRLKLRRGWS